jgi:phage regulator Rha-like protein
MGEALGNANKHELSEEFKELEEKTEARKQATDDILEALETFLRALGRDC